MGVPHSLPFPRYGCCIRPQNPNRCKENHSRMPRSKSEHRRNFSAAFSYPEADATCSGNDLLNINTATEEELMTLPGINRQTAQNIVEYRKHIEGFRKVEDLALVSGVGATRLNHIRAELCVGKRGMSKNSSASSSGIDISMHDNVSRGSAAGQGRTGAAKVNINTSNVFQLMKVRFLSQHLAENIVAYRDRKGPFTTFDDLLKVKGIKPEILGVIQPSLVLTDDAVSITLPSVNGPVMCDVHEELSFRDPPCGKSLELLPLGPLSRSSIRSSTLPASLENSFRIASWNLDRCSCEKMDNPGVREVVAMTILENGFGIVAVQDVTHSESLQKLIDELTSPVLANVKSWPGCRGNWKYIVSPPFSSPSQMSCHLAFLYDTEKDVQLTNSGFVWTTSCTDDQQSIPLFLAEFKVRSSFDITIANIHLEPEEENERLSEALIHPVASILTQYDKQGSKNLLLTGHFGMSPDCPATASLASSDFCPALSAEKFTDIGPDNMKGSMCTENMWLSPALTKAHEGMWRAEVIRSGLTNPWIPNGQWGWGGTASSHCPVMTEFRFGELSNESTNLHEELTDVESACTTFLIGSDS